MRFKDILEYFEKEGCSFSKRSENSMIQSIEHYLCSNFPEENMSLKVSNISGKVGTADTRLEIRLFYNSRGDDTGILFRWRKNNKIELVPLYEKSQQEDDLDMKMRSLLNGLINYQKEIKRY